MLVDFLSNTKNFKDTYASAETKVATTFTTDSCFGEMAVLRFAGVDPHGVKKTSNLALTVSGRQCAIGAKAANEALRDNHLYGGSNKKWFNVHIDETGQGARCVVCVECAHNEVTCQRGADGDVGCLTVADFSDHNDVWILAKHGA